MLDAANMRVDNARELAIWRRVGHRIQAYAMVTMDRERLQRLINAICDWSYAHRSGNGEQDNDKLVAEALERLDHHGKTAVTSSELKPRIQYVLGQLDRAIGSAPHPYGEMALNAKLEINRLAEESLYLAKEVERLRERLEVDPRHGIDGIAARDTTIRMLEEQLDLLRRQHRSKDERGTE